MFFALGLPHTHTEGVCAYCIYLYKYFDFCLFHPGFIFFPITNKQTKQENQGFSCFQKILTLTFV